MLHRNGSFKEGQLRDAGNTTSMIWGSVKTAPVLPDCRGNMFEPKASGVWQEIDRMLSESGSGQVSWGEVSGTRNEQMARTASWQTAMSVRSGRGESSTSSRSRESSASSCMTLEDERAAWGLEDSEDAGDIVFESCAEAPEAVAKDSCAAWPPANIEVLADVNTCSSLKDITLGVHSTKITDDVGQDCHEKLAPRLVHDHRPNRTMRLASTPASIAQSACTAAGILNSEVTSCDVPCSRPTKLSL